MSITTRTFFVLILLATLGASDASAGTWTRRNTTGPRPSERSTPAVATLGTHVYVFGGVKDDFSTNINTFYKDLHRFDAGADTWEVLSPAGDLPPARAFAAAVGHKRSGRVLLFGGANYAPFFAGFVAYDDLWAYSVDRNAWSQLRPPGRGPAGRSRPNMWLVDDKLYVFGGITSTFTVLNDLWVYDLLANTWTELLPSGAAGSPPPRHEAQASAAPRHGKLTLYGGESFDALGGFQVLTDTWEFDLAAGAWSNVTPAPAQDIRPHRNYGAAAIIGSKLYLHGGDTPGGSSGCGAPFPQNPSDELWQFDLTRHAWSRLAPGGDPSARLKRHNSAVVNGRMYIFSGFDFQCDGLTGPGQVWNLDVYSYDPGA